MNVAPLLIQNGAPAEVEIGKFEVALAEALGESDLLERNPQLIGDFTAPRRAPAVTVNPKRPAKNRATLAKGTPRL